MSYLNYLRLVMCFVGIMNEICCFREIMKEVVVGVFVFGDFGF